MNIYFSDFFNIDPGVLEGYGAFNISLINDLPLFIDPFLLFGSEKEEYQKLHDSILKYIAFLKSKSEAENINKAKIKSWYKFSEVKQNWFGYSKVGNSGSGLGMKFGKAFSQNIEALFDDLGKETITESSHLEKATLFEIGVGKDNISDFTTNLIKEFLLEYTQNFALANLNDNQTEKLKIERVYFDYQLERWMPKTFTLPFIFGDYILLTPKDILTKDENWINNHDLKGDFSRVCNSIPNDQLRSEVVNYFKKELPKPKKGRTNTSKEVSEAIHATIRKYPDLIDYYIAHKEEQGEMAKSISEKKVELVKSAFIDNVKEIVSLLQEETNFYEIPPISSYDEALNRIKYLKHVIENNDGYKLFYIDGKPIKRESDLQVIYRLTWFASDFDVNREPNNGRGPVDYAISKGAGDKTLIEFKLAKNTKLKQNLAKQVEVYKKANATNKSIKVILYFDGKELKRVQKIINDLSLGGKENIILIDAGRKPSASNVTLFEN
ncbi:hypothetical protein [Fodinibius salsisoli]|uniref:Uncharacterized protein n=1 Tax=Fodinibius salsisoli TaxID=2820877 RepID=A0ABT3PH34_9BACT|nr:hypothetical protein [Fodinibius salsisoli]MCW9705229.1 hypothetical protein [Fodinibius salsisoli]